MNFFVIFFSISLQTFIKASNIIEGSLIRAVVKMQKNLYIKCS